MRPLKSFLICSFITLSCVASAWPQETLDLPITLREAGWIDSKTSSGQGSRRLALLMGVSCHATHPDWDLFYVKNDIDAMQSALENLPGSFEVKTLRDKDVTHDALESYFTSVLPKQLSGSSDNILIIYYSGHGIIQDNQRSYFTYHTDILADRDRYTRLITESELAGWIDQLKARIDVKVILVMDACASSEKAPKGRATERKLGDACLYATPRNEMARLAPDQSGSAFTKELTLTMADLSRKPRMTLSEVWSQVRAGLGASREDRGPQLYPMGTDIVLFNKQDLSFTVLAVEGETDVELTHGRVYRGEEKMGATPYTFTGLSEGRYRISVDAEGHLKRHAEVYLSARDSGKVFRVPLYPKFMVLEGRVRREGPGKMDDFLVEVLGSRGSFFSGWHTSSSRLDGKGAFRLFVPHDAEITGIRLMQGSRRVASLDFELDSMTPFNRVWEGNPVPVYALEAVTVAGEAAVKKSDLALKEEAGWLYEMAERYMTTGQTDDLDVAIDYYRQAAKDTHEEKTREHLASRIRQAYERLFRYLYGRSLFKRGAEEAGGALRFSPDDVFFKDWKETFERENIPSASRDRLAEAASALECSSLKKAEDLYAELLDSGDLTPFYKERVEANLADIRGVMFQDNFYKANLCIIEGKDQDAVAPYMECRRLRPDSFLLRPLERKVGPYLDSEPPILDVFSPRGGEATVNEPTFTVKGRIRDDKRVKSLVMDHDEVPLSGSDTDKTFSTKVPLKEGMNRFLLEAFDWRGHKVSSRVEITYSKTPVIQGFTYLKEETFSCGGERNTVKIFRHDRTGLEFVLVPGGTFNMGSPSAESGRDSDEGPQHRVTIKPFLICRTECTQEAWDKIGGDDERTWKGSDLPIESVSWEACSSWCRKAGLRLPTEAEWEYACRAGTTGRFCFGDSDSMLSSYGWYDDDSGGKTHQVGGKKVNAFGLYDMHGNVWEWCQDWYQNSYSGAPTDGSAWEPSGSSSRVVRGGSWRHDPRYCRSAIRIRNVPGLRNDYLGFRPALSLP